MEKPKRKTSLQHSPSLMLSQDANSRLHAVLEAKTQALCTAFVSVVVSMPPEQPEWKPYRTGVVATLVKDHNRKSYFIQVYDIVDWEKIREEKLTKGTAYHASSPTFHQFETSTGKAMGMKFSLETEARSFAQVARDITMTGHYKNDGPPLNAKANDKTTAGGAADDRNNQGAPRTLQRPPRPNREPPKTPPPPPPSSSNAPVRSPPAPAPPPPGPSLSNASLPSPPTPPPARSAGEAQSLPATPMKKDAPSAPITGAQPVKSPAVVSQLSTSTLDRKKLTRKITKDMIGTPTNFQHVTHIGFDPDLDYETLQEKMIGPVRKFSDEVQHPSPARRSHPPGKRNSIQLPITHAPTLKSEKWDKIVANEQVLDIPPTEKKLSETQVPETLPPTETQGLETLPPTETQVLETLPPTETQVLETLPSTETQVLETLPPTETQVLETLSSTETQVLETLPPTEKKLPEAKVMEALPATEKKLPDAQVFETLPFTEKKLPEASEIGVKSSEVELEGTVTENSVADNDFESPKESKQEANLYAESPEISAESENNKMVETNTNKVDLDVSVENGSDPFIEADKMIPETSAEFSNVPKSEASKMTSDTSGEYGYDPWSRELALATSTESGNGQMVESSNVALDTSRENGYSVMVETSKSTQGLMEESCKTSLETSLDSENNQVVERSKAIPETTGEYRNDQMIELSENIDSTRFHNECKSDDRMIENVSYDQAQSVLEPIDLIVTIDPKSLSDITLLPDQVQSLTQPKDITMDTNPNSSLVLESLSLPKENITMSDTSESKSSFVVSNQECPKIQNGTEETVNENSCTQVNNPINFDEEILNSLNELEAMLEEAATSSQDQVSLRSSNKTEEEEKINKVHVVDEDQPRRASSHRVETSITLSTNDTDLKRHGILNPPEASNILDIAAVQSSLELPTENFHSQNPPKPFPRKKSKKSTPPPPPPTPTDAD